MVSNYFSLFFSCAENWVEGWVTCPQIEETIIQTLKRRKTERQRSCDLEKWHSCFRNAAWLQSTQENDHFLLLCSTPLPPFQRSIFYDHYSPSKLAANPFWQNFVSIKNSMHDWLKHPNATTEFQIERKIQITFFPSTLRLCWNWYACIWKRTDYLF